MEHMKLLKSQEDNSYKTKLGTKEFTHLIASFQIQLGMCMSIVMSCICDMEICYRIVRFVDLKLIGRHAI